MKKRSRKVKIAKKATRRAVKHSRSASLPVISFHRIVIFSACVLLVIFGVAFLRGGTVTRSVAGISIARGFFDQATVSLPQVSGATSYNIYYKQVSDPTFIHAVRNIPTNMKSYTISYLKKNTTYNYKISAADFKGSEFWWSPVEILSNIESM
jgi:hypothetical protein